jgi:hypothetical protein
MRPYIDEPLSGALLDLVFFGGIVTSIKACTRQRPETNRKKQALNRNPSSTLAVVLAFLATKHPELEKRLDVHPSRRRL